MFIDPHVHCRDEKQRYKETIEHALHVADRAGFTAIFDMPNTDPPVLTRERVLVRMNLAQAAHSPVFYGTYVGVTAAPEQIREAVAAWREISGVVGLKLYAGHSVGELGVTAEAQQQSVYSELVKNNFTGVLAVHCEKESLLRPGLWDARAPITHAFARPPEAEIESVADQIAFAGSVGFRGILHIAHISTPDAVSLVRNAKRSLRITCGVCPHHLVLAADAMESNGARGLLYKMNPPLRTADQRDQLLIQLREGAIDWIETDHAPHALEEKLGPPYLSGIPGLAFYPRFVTWLAARGVSQDQIEKLTFRNAADAFGLGLRPRRIVPDVQLASEYAYDPFGHVSA